MNSAGVLVTSYVRQINLSQDVAALQAEVATQNEVIQGLAKNEEKQRIELEKVSVSIQTGRRQAS